MEHAQHHQLPAETGVPDEKDSGLGVHTRNIIDGMDKVKAMADLAESVIVWRAQYIAWNVDIFEAETLLFRLIFRENSRNPQAMDMLARIYFQQGKYEKARDLWNRALELQPGNPALRRTVTEIRSMAKSPGSMVARHRISVFLNCLILLIFICVTGLAIPRVYNLMMGWAGGTATIVGQNPSESSFGDHYKKYASTYKKDDVSPKFDDFIPYPFSAAGRGAVEKRLPGLIVASFAEEKTSGGNEAAAERKGDALKMPGIVDFDPRGLAAGRTYRVNRGDTLWIIAEKVYGQGSLWTLIAGANGIRNPNKLIMGQELILPQSGGVLTGD
ncbi:MAG: LysM peptidoglycan-binding domain-containing protein [Synergistaceae bacterium]|nr:LysM peptidoglycan-binding domain-containing protein [Synergistaceae bacterium]